MRRSILYILCVILTLTCQLFKPLQPYAEYRADKTSEFELSDLQGKKHLLSDYRGKLVLINFWASWCPECIQELPSLNALYDKYKGKDLVVLGITADRKKDPVLQVLQKTQVSYPVLLDISGGVFIRQFTVIGLPTTVLIDRNGHIVDRLVGRTDFLSAAFTSKIQHYLSAQETR